MKVVLRPQYGPPDVLQFAKVGKPTPTNAEVLIKIEATSVNPLDWRILRGSQKRWLSRRRPRNWKVSPESGPPHSLEIT
jgi:NADPH:quinone reductase-like Zn-dependent oxidoreductase